MEAGAAWRRQGPGSQPLASLCTPGLWGTTQHPTSFGVPQGTWVLGDTPAFLYDSQREKQAGSHHS